MIVFSSEHLQLSRVQDINVPVCKTVDIVNSNILISADDGIYYGVYNNVKKLTLNKDTNCLLKNGGGLITVHNNYISSINQKIDCDFYPSKVLPMSNYCLYYNPNGYFSHLKDNELKSHLLPHTILKKPINCAGYITYKNDIFTLLVTGHSIYQFKNGNNEYELESTLEFGIFGIVDAYSSWMCISIIDHQYSLVELDPVTLKVSNITPLRLTDKLVFNNAYILNSKLVILCSNSISVFDLGGQLLQNVEFPDNLKLAAASPLSDRDEKLRFLISEIDKNRRFSNLSLFALETSKTTQVRSFKEYTPLINFLLFGWVNVHEYIEIPNAIFQSFLISLLSFQFMPLDTIEFHLNALAKALKYYNHLKITVPSNCLSLFLFKQMGFFLCSTNLNPLFLQQCCVKIERTKLSHLFMHNTVDFNFFKGCSNYFNSQIGDKEYGLQVATKLLDTLFMGLTIVDVPFVGNLPDICIGTYLTSCLQRGLHLSDVANMDEFVFACGQYVLYILQFDADLRAFEDLFKLVISYYYKIQELEVLGDLLRKYPHLASIQNAIFYENNPNYALCDYLMPDLNKIVFDAFIGLKRGELLINFITLPGAMDYIIEYPEIRFLFYAKLGNFEKSNHQLTLAIERYEQEHGIEFNAINKIKPKNMGFALDPAVFDYPVFFIF